MLLVLIIMIWRFTFLVNNPTIQLQTENSFKLIHFLGGIIMKNMDAYIIYDFYRFTNPCRCHRFPDDSC